MWHYALRGGVKRTIYQLVCQVTHQKESAKHHEHENGDDQGNQILTGTHAAMMAEKERRCDI